MNISKLRISKLSLAAAATGFYLIDKDDIDRTFVGSVRSFRTFSTCLQIAFDYQYSLQNTQLPLQEYNNLKSSCHQRSADRILKLCKDNGGVYVKLGQHLSALVYLLPREYTQTLRALQDQCPPSSFKDIDALFLSDTGKSIADTFSFFDENPIGVASLAQVHYGILKDSGEKVAVKVQHPSLDYFTDVDIKTVVSTVKIIKKWFPDFEFDWLAKEMQTSLPQEMNFELEALNAIKIANNLKGNSILKIPDVYQAKRRILIMEHISGERIDNIEYLKKNNISPFKVSAQLAKIYSQMVFIDGFVHCDPHPGNIVIRPKVGIWQSIPFSSWIPGIYNFEIVLLDHGLYRTLSNEFRLDYAHLWSSLIKCNEQDIEKYSHQLFLHSEKSERGEIDHHRLFASMLTGRSWEAISSDSKGFGIATTRTEEELNLITTKVTQSGFLIAISDILAKLPKELLLLLKTNDLLRSIDESLGVTKSNKSHMLLTVQNMGWYCALAIWNETSRKKKNTNPLTFWLDKEYWGNVYEFYNVASRLLIFKLMLKLGY